MMQKLIFSGSTIEDDKIYGGVTYLCAMPSDNFSIGGVISAQLTFTLDVYHEIGEEFEFQVDSFSRGRFVITSVEHSENGTWSYQAFDLIQYTEKIVDSWYNSEFNFTDADLQTFFSSLCTKCGVPASTLTINGDMPVSKTTVLQNTTGRTVLGWIAEAAAGTCMMENNHVVIKGITPTIISVDNEDYKRKTVSDYSTPQINRLWIGRENGELGLEVN